MAIRKTKKLLLRIIAVRSGNCTTKAKGGQAAWPKTCIVYHIRSGIANIISYLHRSIEGKVFYGEKKKEIGAILRKLCEWKGINIIEAEMCPDHVHMLVEIPPKIAVSSFMGYLKGKSSTMLYEKFGELKYKYRNREFWCTGYYVDTVGKNKTKIAEYIKHQLDEDKIGDQLTMFDKNSPFTGSK